MSEMGQNRPDEQPKPQNPGPSVGDPPVSDPTDPVQDPQSPGSNPGQDEPPVAPGGPAPKD